MSHLLEPKPLRMTCNPDEEASTLKSSDSERFEDLLATDSFVDKTLLIRAIFYRERLLSDGETMELIKVNTPLVMVTAPSRFGKTVNISMIERFLELQVDDVTGAKITRKDLEKDAVDDTANYEMFCNTRQDNLEIMQDKHFVRTYFGKYPIIKASFLCTRAITTYEDAVVECKNVVHCAFRNHRYLCRSMSLEDYEIKKCQRWCTYPDYHSFKINDVVEGLRDLSEYLKKHFQRQAFVLIDAFDAVITRALFSIQDEKQLKRIVIDSIGVIANVLKDNSRCIAGGFITGVLDLGGIGMPDLLGNVAKYSFAADHHFVPYYGFTTNEVMRLCQKWSIEEDLQQEAIFRYGGYYTLNEYCMSNPYSIVRFLSTRTLENYWQTHSCIEGFKEILKSVTAMQVIVCILDDKSVEYASWGNISLDDILDLHKSIMDASYLPDFNLIYTYLLGQGYLSYSLDNVGSLKLKVPNSEVTEILSRVLTKCIQT